MTFWFFFFFFFCIFKESKAIYFLWLVYLTAKSYFLWKIFVIKTWKDNTTPQSCGEQIIDEICPLTIPNQISTISMHISSLMKIHWYLLKLSPGNENTDGRMDNRRTDEQKDDQRETVIPWHHRPITKFIIIIFKEYDLALQTIHVKCQALFPLKNTKLNKYNVQLQLWLAFNFEMTLLWRTFTGLFCKWFF